MLPYKKGLEMSVHHFLSIHLDLEKKTNCKFTDAHVNVDGKRNR